MRPLVSILVAVRDEEAVILRCLQGLQKLNYPPSCLQILIGNDESTDGTAQIIQDFVVGKEHFEIHHITQKIGTQVGKGNVLAQLARKAKGAYFLITDADVEVSPDWVDEVIKHFENEEEMGVASHFTWIKAEDSFSACQALEWSLALGIFAQVSAWGIGITAQGNNMAVKREAYESTGGYEHIPFSVTEDAALFWAILAKGYKFKNIVHTKGSVESLPAQSWHALLKQRRRWIVGALGLGTFWQIILWSRAFALPLLCLLYLYLPTTALTLGIFGISSQAVLLTHTLWRVGKLRYLGYYPFFVFYQEIVLLGTAYYYFTQRSVHWKGRTYSP